MCVCGCVDIIVWAGREVSGWNSLDCSSPLSVCLLVGVAVIVSVCGGCRHNCVVEEGSEWVGQL